MVSINSPKHSISIQSRAGRLASGLRAKQADEVLRCSSNRLRPLYVRRVSMDARSGIVLKHRDQCTGIVGPSCWGELVANAKQRLIRHRPVSKSFFPRGTGFENAAIFFFLALKFFFCRPRDQCRCQSGLDGLVPFLFYFTLSTPSLPRLSLSSKAGSGEQGGA